MLWAVMEMGPCGNPHEGQAKVHAEVDSGERGHSCDIVKWEGGGVLNTTWADTTLSLRKDQTWASKGSIATGQITCMLVALHTRV